MRIADPAPSRTATQATVVAAAFALTLVATAPGVAAEPVELLPTAVGDLVAGELPAPAEVPPALSVERRPLAASWLLPRDREIELAYRPQTARSRSFTLRADAAELASAGVTVPTTHPGAVVRLAPVDPVTGPPIDPASVVVVGPRGEEHAAGSGVELPVGDAALRAAGLPFAPGTTAFRLRPELGRGPFVLRAPTVDANGPDYLVHVFERGSDLALTLTTERDAHLAGETLTVLATLAGGPAARLERIDGHVLAPSGRRLPLALRRLDARRFVGERRLDAAESMADGPWQVVARAQGSREGLAVRRDGVTSFGYAVPTARLDGSVHRRDQPGGLAVAFGVETAVDGRFELRGVIFGSDAEGALRPLAAVHSAAWIGRGRGELELSLDAELLAESGLRAPYEVRDLRLLDQGRLGLLHRQSRAARLE